MRSLVTGRPAKHERNFRTKVSTDTGEMSFMLVTDFKALSSRIGLLKTCNFLAANSEPPIFRVYAKHSQARERRTLSSIFFNFRVICAAGHLELSIPTKRRSAAKSQGRKQPKQHNFISCTGTQSTSLPKYSEILTSGIRAMLYKQLLPYCNILMQ